MTDNFPLFRLPYVALYNVLNYVGLNSVLPLSLCSKRAKLIMKNYHGPSKKVSIDFHIAHALKVDLTTLIEVNIVPELPTHIERVTIGARKVPVKMEDGILKTYWTDKKDGMATIIKYTLDVFNAKFHSLKAYVTLSSADVRFWIELIKKFQEKIDTLFVWLSTDNQDELTKYILESDIVTGYLELSLPTSFDCWRLRPDPRPYSMDVLCLRPSYWVTLDHLLAMDIKKISLRYTHLTCQDINVFLKKWIEGECSKRTKEIFLDISRGIEFAVLLNDIEVTERDSNFDIRRKTDGAMATVIVNLWLQSVTVVF